VAPSFRAWPLILVLASCGPTGEGVWCINVDIDAVCPDDSEASKELVGKSDCGVRVVRVLGLAYREDRGDHTGCCYDAIERYGQDSCD
jgi:hypothetical protein